MKILKRCEVHQKLVYLNQNAMQQLIEEFNKAILVNYLFDEKFCKINLVWTYDNNSLLFYSFKCKLEEAGWVVQKMHYNMQSKILYIVLDL